MAPVSVLRWRHAGAELERERQITAKLEAEAGIEPAYTDLQSAA